MEQKQYSNMQINNSAKCQQSQVSESLIWLICLINSLFCNKIRFLQAIARLSAYPFLWFMVRKMKWKCLGFVREEYGKLLKTTLQAVS